MPCPDFSRWHAQLPCNETLMLSLHPEKMQVKRRVITVMISVFCQRNRNAIALAGQGWVPGNPAAKQYRKISQREMKRKFCVIIRKQILAGFPDLVRISRKYSRSSSIQASSSLWSVIGVEHWSRPSDTPSVWTLALSSETSLSGAGQSGRQSTLTTREKLRWWERDA